MSQQKSPSVLVADDNPENLRVVSQLLEGSGLSIRLASSGEKALEHARRFAPDVVLLDILMPGLDGFETCRRLKNQPSTRDIPVIFMTALSDSDSLMKGFDAGAVDYLTKPLRRGELLARVNTHVTIRRQQQKLESQNDELRTLQRAIEQVTTSVVITDLRGVITFVNPSFVTMSGYSAAETIGNKPSMLKSGKHPQELYNELWATIAGGEVWKGDLLNKRKNGELYWEFAIISPVKDAQGKITHYLAINEDVTIRKSAEEGIAYMAYHDSLTGLANRYAFLRQLTNTIDSAELRGGTTGLFFVDLDGFKAVNDTHGHDVGDQLLKGVAHRMADFIRNFDMAGRLGGDEFVVQLANVGDEGTTLRLANKLCALLAEPFTLGELELAISCSIGVALYPRHAASPETLMKRADEAMYLAKSRGKNRVEVAT